MNPFITESTQKVSEKLIAGTDYVEVADGNQATHKYVNLNNEDYCKRDGVVEFIPMKNNKGIGGTFKHENVKVFRTVLDRVTGLTWGVPLSVDHETKEIKHQQFRVEGSVILDLSVKSQAILAAMIKNSTFCEGSPNLIGTPVYKVLDKEKQAEANVKNITYRRKAEDIIFNLKEDGLIEMALNIGVNVSANKKLSMLTAEIHRVMNLDPEKFVKIYENPNRVFTSIFNRGRHNNIITHDVAVGDFKYNGLTLGHSQEMAVKYLMDNDNIATTIELRSKEHEKSSNRTLVKAEPVKVSVDTEKEAMRKRIEELESKANANKWAEDVKLEEFKAPFEVEDNSAAEDELIILRAKAKSYKIQGAHLATRDTLISKIAEYESKQ